jgi:hypothetical protein
MTTDAKKCLTLGCENRYGEGTFVGDLCSPCHEMITTGRVHHRNPTFIGDLWRQADKLKRLVEFANSEVN